MELKPGYKQAEVGVIPEDWNCSALGNLCDTSSGTTPSRSLVERYFRGGTINWVKTLDLNNSVIFSTDERVTEAALNETSLRVYPKNTVLVAMYGGFNQIGRTGILSVPACVNQAITAVRCGTQLYAGYLLATLNFKVEYWKSVASSSRKDPNITSKDIRDFVISYPPKAEQQAIAEALSDADALIESLDHLIAKKRQIKQGAMQELLTGNRRLAAGNGEWESRRLGEVAEFFKGKGLPKSQIVPDGTDACIHYGELFTQYPETINEIFGRTNGSKDSFRSLANDVLMPTSDVTPRGLAKASCLRVDGVVLGGDILVIRPNKKMLNGSFLSYLIRQKEDSVLQLVTGSTVFHLYGSDMKKFSFLMPPLSEQNEIVSVLSGIDTEIVALKSQLVKARQIKQGMMQELLTGRIRLL